MNRELATKIANSVLYEGYMLYPYRPSALKNQHRWTFGTLYPAPYEGVHSGTERSVMHSECLLRAEGQAAIRIELRFLHLLSRQLEQRVGECYQPVPSLTIGKGRVESWDEAVERSLEFEVELSKGVEHRFDFHFDGFLESELLRDETDNVVGRAGRAQHAVSGVISVRWQSIGNGVLKLLVDVMNQTPLSAAAIARDAALLRSLLSAHLILTVTGGRFVSLLQPPEFLRDAVKACRNEGNLPVLVGTQGEDDMLLCSPILLYDYPQVAPESAGDFFDATEMDEMLTLRVMTLTDQEKREMREADDRLRVLLQRTEETAREQLMKTHGAIRSLRPIGEE